jgi:hypothetical protein
LHPGGDRGGNSFLLKGKAKNLHSAWDSSVNVFEDKVEQELALEIMQEHSRASLATDMQVTDTEKMGAGQFYTCKEKRLFYYGGSAEPAEAVNDLPEDDGKIGHRQAALAGYRLADRLEELLS